MLCCLQFCVVGELAFKVAACSQLELCYTRTVGDLVELHARAAL